MLDDETQYRVMRLLEANPDITQRDVAKELGVSLGKANYSVQTLIRKRWVKAVSVKNTQQKAAYLYSLTRLGLQEKARLTVRFVAKKMREYEGLLVEIDEMERGLQRRVARSPRARGKQG